MKKLGLFFFAFLLICLASSTASAATIALFDWATNIDGIVVSQPSAPGGFDPSTGLGIWTITQSGVGAHSVLAFFDHEIDEASNTFFNEFGSVFGAPAAGQSYEIDEPEYGNPITGYLGDIYTNYTGGVLDNGNMVSVYGAFPGGPEDISMAMGWDFALGVDEIATIRFHLDDSLPVGAAPPAFYLQQTDPDSQASVYFWSDVNIQTGGEPPIPEPSTIVLVLSGLGLAAAARFRKSI